MGRMLDTRLAGLAAIVGLAVALPVLVIFQIGGASQQVRLSPSLLTIQACIIHGGCANGFACPCHEPRILFFDLLPAVPVRFIFHIMINDFCIK
jgi:hypothetical protein